MGKNVFWTFSSLLCAFQCSGALAVEGGASQQPIGGDGFSAAYLPPQGVFEVLNYTVFRTADRFNDGNGNRLSARDFNLFIYGDALRTLYVHRLSFLGADVASQAIVSYLHADLTASGRTSSTSGIGDVTVTPLLLSWNHSEALHGLAGLDFNLPTGAYDKNAFINLGTHHFSFDPFYGITYTVPDGPEVMVAAFYNVNTENSATHYRNGDEFLSNFAFGWNVGPWSLGVQGSVWTQVTDDRQNGRSVGTDGNRGQIVAAGPSVRYVLAPNAFGFAWWERDFVAHNATQGGRGILKVAILF